MKTRDIFNQEPHFLTLKTLVMNYINFVFCALAFLLFSISGKAQKITIGAITGSNLSGYSFVGNPGDEKNNYSHILSYNINFFAKYRFNDKWSINLEPGVIVRGGKYDRFGISTRIAALYAQLPVLAEYQITDKLSVFGGLEIAYLLNERNNSRGLQSAKGYLGFQAGLNYKLSKRIDLGFVYGRSLSPQFSFTEYANNSVVKEYSRYSHNFQLRLRFNLVTRKTNRNKVIRPAF